MKPGLIYKQVGHIYPYDEYEGYVYGYDNRYAVMYLRRLGGVLETEGAQDGRYKVTLIGMGLMASEIRMLPPNVMNGLFEQLTEEEAERIVSMPELADLRSRYDAENRCYEALTAMEASRLRDMVMMLPERPALHVVKDPAISPYYTVKMRMDELAANKQVLELFSKLRREEAEAIAFLPELADLRQYYNEWLRRYRDMDIADARRVLAAAERVPGPRE